MRSTWKSVCLGSDRVKWAKVDMPIRLKNSHANLAFECVRLRTKRSCSWQCMDLFALCVRLVSAGRILSLR